MRDILSNTKIVFNFRAGEHSERAPIGADGWDIEYVINTGSRFLIVKYICANTSYNEGFNTIIEKDGASRHEYTSHSWTVKGFP